MFSRHEQILNQATFAENMQPCARVNPKILSTLTSVLRNGCEFGIDFEIALGMRRHLQKLYGFSQLPSLSQVTVLGSDLLIISLANIAPHSSIHMRELEQWLDFLIDFYFQESGNELASANSDPTAPTLEFQLVSSSKSNENVSSIEAPENGESTKEEDEDIHCVNTKESVEKSANECAISSDINPGSIEEAADAEKQHLIEENSGESAPFDETKEEKDENICSSSSSSPECLSGVRTPIEDDQLIKQQMAAALESYRRQKRLQTRIVNTEPKSPRMTKVRDGVFGSHLNIPSIITYFYLSYRPQRQSYREPCYFQLFDFCLD